MEGVINYDGAAFALIWSMTALIPSQMEMSVNISTTLPWSVKGGS